MVYTTKILKAGALIPDTLELLADWDEQMSVQANLSRLRESNLFNKSTRVRVKNILRIFRQRYLVNDSLSRSLAVLVKGNLPADTLKPILYFFAASADDLLRDTVLIFLSSRRSSGWMHIRVEDLKRELRDWIAHGKIKDDWTENTLTKVARGLMATLRDFGVLQGAANKSLAPVYLPVEAFAYIAFYMKSRNPSGESLVKNPLWGLYFLTSTEVERLLVQADQRQLLSYQAAGSVVRIDFPVTTIEAYADVVLHAAT